MAIPYFKTLGVSLGARLKEILTPENGTMLSMFFRTASFAGGSAIVTSMSMMLINRPYSFIGRTRKGIFRVTLSNPPDPFANICEEQLVLLMMGEGGGLSCVTCAKLGASFNLEDPIGRINRSHQ